MTEEVNLRSLDCESESDKSVQKKYSSAVSVPKFGDTFKVSEMEREGGGYACGICKKEVKETHNGLGCDACETWYHCGCIKITQDEYKLIQKMGNQLCWSCGRCGLDIKKQNELLKSENEKLRTELEEIKKKINKVDDKLEEIGKNIKNNIIQEVKKEIIEEIREDEERKLKKRNLVIYKVMESKDDIENGEQHDLRFCNELFSDGLQIANVKIEKTVRLGRLPENQISSINRPLLVVLENKDKRYEILKNARNLRKSSSEVFRKTFIAPDLTRKEREARKKLIDELSQRRQDGESGWYIKNGQLMRNREFDREGNYPKKVDENSVSKNLVFQTGARPKY